MSHSKIKVAIVAELGVLDLVVMFLNVAKHGSGFVKRYHHTKMIDDLRIAFPRHFGIEKLYAIDQCTTDFLVCGALLRWLWMTLNKLQVMTTFTIELIQ